MASNTTQRQCQTCGGPSSAPTAVGGHRPADFRLPILHDLSTTWQGATAPQQTSPPRSSFHAAAAHEPPKDWAATTPPSAGIEPALLHTSRVVRSTSKPYVITPALNFPMGQPCLRISSSALGMRGSEKDEVLAQYSTSGGDAVADRRAGEGLPSCLCLLLPSHPTAGGAGIEKRSYPLNEGQHRMDPERLLSALQLAATAHHYRPSLPHRSPTGNTGGCR
ncbi:hypothetical protein B2J93_822 [Marssonina coronariae]|uniref:Uncharacterized protein n=1 Tax=Diplocarpon coronariae TaxID=2795749 RepID=A0A218ZF60_9HELO|nr:hypothetical protein B2J93_822 [Marssonina coronariae]